jgi:hypothetical protein
VFTFGFSGLQLPVMIGQFRHSASAVPGVRMDLPLLNTLVTEVTQTTVNERTSNTTALTRTNEFAYWNGLHIHQNQFALLSQVHA